jgi:hypothetical protein
LEIGGKNIRTLVNQLLKRTPITLHGYIDSLGGNVLGWADKLDAGPD